ncbi:DNA-J related domain-containing protein [Marinobacter mobilis]|uniref:DNA-J related protein n=1 Tax=Marinobacter mobilis TaxID=488533 RepID=A0A1H2UI75_9GAMM|nr:DNA-J related domain-containing protein [Marinobacter mobilis]SDW55790.1 DNA-J related protein [Marinobacter mobilis]
MSALTNPDNSTATRPADSADQERLEDQIQHLMVAVEHILRGASAPLSELALIKALQAEPWLLVDEVDYADPTRLFPVHFLLFHSLYRLRDTLAAQGEKLAISPLEIYLECQATVAGQGLPGKQDTLREFYLDLDQYRLSDSRIQQMMDDFWSGHQGRPVAHSDLQKAARTLGFDSVPEQFAPVKHQFRRAVMTAHPDRGGDTRKIQQLNEAFALFRAHFCKAGKR